MKDEKEKCPSCLECGHSNVSAISDFCTSQSVPCCNVAAEWEGRYLGRVKDGHSWQACGRALYRFRCENAEKGLEGELSRGAGWVLSSLIIETSKQAEDWTKVEPSFRDSMTFIGYCRASMVGAVSTSLNASPAASCREPLDWSEKLDRHVKIGLLACIPARVTDLQGQHIAYMWEDKGTYRPASNMAMTRVCRQQNLLGI